MERLCSCVIPQRDDVEESDAEDETQLIRNERTDDGSRKVSRQRGAFEDNLERPSCYSYLYLNGRCMSGYSKQPLGVKWVYQRLINRVMQLFVSTPWYEVTVDSDEIEQTLASTILYMVGILAAPVVFPVLYSVSAIGFIALTPCIRAFKQVEAVPAGPFSERFEARHLEESRYSYSEILSASVQSLWFCWISLFPWLYLVQGRLLCDTAPRPEEKNMLCPDPEVAFSSLVVFTPWVCCMAASWRYTHNVLATSYDCAIHKQQMAVLKDPAYGQPLMEVMKKLGDPAHPKSFYPIFMADLQDEPDKLPGGKAEEFLFRCIVLIHSLMPLIWYTIKFRTPFLPLHAGFWPQAVIFTGVLAPNHEMYTFLHDFYIASVEFQHVVDELLIMVYLGSSFKSKKRPVLSRAVKRVWQRNDTYRKNNFNKFMQGGSSIKVEFLEDEQDRWNMQQTRGAAGLHRAQETSDLQKVAPVPLDRQGSRRRQRWDELTNLHVHQVTFNFSTKEGVLFFRRFRRYVRVDIFNERKEVEQYINACLVMMAVMFVFLLTAQWYYHDLTALCIIFPFDISILAVLILASLNKCVAANEFLFGCYERVLLSWKEQTLEPDCYYGHQNAKDALAFVWDLDEGKPRALRLERDDMDTQEMPRETEAARRAELRETLDIASNMETLLEDKLRILGFEVTKELRNRLVASMLSVMVAVISKNVWTIVQVLQTTYDRFGDQAMTLIMDRRDPSEIWKNLTSTS